MLQPTLLSLPDVGLYALGVQPLLVVELGEALNMTRVVRSKVTGQSQKMIDFWDEFARNLRLTLAMTAW